jgi:hypothetical protein
VQAVRPEDQEVWMSIENLEELRGCLERLNDLRAEFNAVLAIFGRDASLIDERKILAQEKLNYLKVRLRREYAAGEHGLAEAERIFYFRAVHAALTSITVAYDTRPDQRWIDQIGNACSSIDLAISRLKQKLSAIEE